jgi:hypothetical protein
VTFEFVPAVRPTGYVPPEPWVYETRLMTRVEVTDLGCWTWTGPLAPNGYGQINAWNKRWLVHRLAHTVMVGTIPDGYQVDHLCRVRNCINPEHLEAVTQAENLRRQGAAVEKCPRGHAYTDSNTYRAPSSPSSRRCRICAYLRNLKG